MQSHLLTSLIAFGGMSLAWGASIPGTMRYMEFPNALPGTILKVYKDLDPETGMIRLVSNHPLVSDVDQLLLLEKEEEGARRMQLGALYPSLAEKLESLGPNVKVRVAIRVKTPAHVFLDKTRHGQNALIANSQSFLARSPAVSPSAVAARYGLSVREPHGADIMIVSAGRQALEQLKHDPDVASIWEDVSPNVLSPELSTLATSGYNPGPVPSGAGSGVKVATFERGVTSTFLSCIGITPVAYDVFTLTGVEHLKRHSQATFKTLAATVPSATFYHRNSLTYNSTNDINYLVNNSIQTVSMSVDRGGTSPHRATYSEFLSMDNLAYVHPFPVFANPTANSGYAYEVNWQCYNCISVGNVRHTDNSTYELADCTQTKNPPPRYGSCISGSGADCAGDRELPHLVAPGIPSSGTTFATTCLEGTSTVICGTSFSTPVVNGLAAAVIAADSRLVSWPEMVRATLILTAQNVESGHWTVSGDERDGSGTVSGTDAVAFAAGHTSVSPGNGACEKGMGAGSFYASDFGSSKRFHFLVPNPKPSGKHLRVVLTWDSNPNVSAGTNDLSDLDLVVAKNGGTQPASSWDSNVEVVDIAAADLTAGSSYNIDIVPYVNRIPSGSFFYYSIAWAWVADEAP